VTYLVIDPDGTVRHEQQAPTLERIDAIVQHGGWARVHVDPDWDMAGWVSDCGLVTGAARNPAGACVLATLGAGQQPYAGPVVITGYDHDSDWGGPEQLHPTQAVMLDGLVGAVRAVLAGRQATASWVTPEWVRQTREYAEMVRTAEAPGMRVLSPEESAAYLRGRWPL
jgi:hypothetical protein